MMIKLYLFLDLGKELLNKIFRVSFISCEFSSLPNKMA